jgi:hypothetical protein
MLGDLAGDLVIRASTELLILLGRGLGHLDLWCERTFGRSLSGRINKVEIQTLFHGNTRDQDQI